ncbi:hypothetical protein [Dyadobacter luticola]|uniref:Uncharacterized protein n=1 Tax=Dyadobacter luticola TaxID=1979387 RepID=A0A5R9KYG5_9BACT|nr:hypothetical protein [Dyadobacter luticola]TLV01323.1 hypothetical protein FEN17_17970 [Dyadobacter luticola]
MKIYCILITILVIASGNPIYPQKLDGSKLVITRTLPGGSTYMRSNRKGILANYPYLYVRKDGKVTLITKANPFRHSFNQTSVEITNNKSFGDSLGGPLNIKGLPNLSIPQGIDTAPAKEKLKLNSNLTKKQREEKGNEIDQLSANITSRLNTIRSLQRSLVDLSDEYELKRTTYKERYRILQTNLFDRTKLLEEKKLIVLDSISLVTLTKQTFEDFFRPFSSPPSTTLTSFINEYAVNRINALKTEVEGPGGLNELYQKLRDQISTIKVLATKLLEEDGDKLSPKGRQMLVDLTVTSQTTLFSLEKTNSDLQKMNDILKSTDWPLQFTRFWEAKEEILNAQFSRILEATATGDQVTIKQSFRLIHLEDGKVISGKSETDTTYIVKVKGILHINISGGLGFPFRTEDKYIVKSDGTNSVTMGTIERAKAGIGSPYLVTMFDISWSNYSNVTPLVSTGIGYPIAGGSLAGFVGGGVAFGVAGRRVLFHSGVSYIQSKVLSGGYKTGDTVAGGFEVPVVTGYKVKPFFSFTYNLGQLK